MQTQALRTQDAPPLSIPLSFFLTAPVAIAMAGVTLAFVGAPALTSKWSPVTVGLTHLGTLGFITMVMVGALYQMTAVVVGSPVPRVRLAHGVHALLAFGVAALVGGFVDLATYPIWLAIFALGPAILLFLVPMGIALGRARSLTPTSFGIGAAVACLFFSAFAGLWMAHGWAGHPFPGPRGIWVQAHLGVALLGWVGGLISAVSWQVIPMFYLAREVPRRLAWTLQLATLAGAVLPLLWLGVATFGTPVPDVEVVSTQLAMAALPAALAVWVLHPAVTAWSLAGRRRKRSDASLPFWWTGLLVAPLVAAAAAAAWALPSEKWDLLFGWLAIWGWAGAIVHGMLTRIVPFLVWLHRFAPLVGRVAVPSVRKLLPDRWGRIGLALHITTLLVGVVAIATGQDLLCRATGLGLLATAAWMTRVFLHVVGQRRAGAGGLSIGPEHGRADSD